MRTIRPISAVPLMLALALVTAACGKGNSGSSPLAPSAAGAPVSSAPAPAAGGATISGVVVSGSQVAGFTAPSFGGFSSLAAGVRYTITVNGTSITVTSNDDGSFVLPNVPTGDLTLTITGPNGFSAQLVIPGVELNEQVRITVRVQGGTAELDDEEHVSDTKAEVEGRIVSVTGDTLVIGARLVSVVVPAGTPIRHGGTPKTFADLVPGVRVHVKASRAGDLLTALEVKLQNANQGPSNKDDDDDDEDEAKVEGAITGAITGSCPTLTFTVGTRTVRTNASTEFDDVTCSALATGRIVKVEGAPQQDGSILAKEVEAKDGDDDDDDEEEEEDEAEVSGTISGAITGSCPNLTFTVGSTVVKTNSSTEFDDVSCSTLKTGDNVKVEGVKQPDNSLLASEVEKKSTTSGGDSSKNKGRR